MAKSQETFNKKEKEKQKQKKREEKAQKKLDRKANSSNKEVTFESMIAYVDEYGNFSSTPPDPTKKRSVNADQIEIGVPRRREEAPEEAGRTGVITFFNESKGFGFIKDAKSQESIFTHINGHIDKLKENDKVTFEVEQGMKGPNAVRVKLLK
ncbi:MAG TPA: cold shock domain-containing protein [Cyclobacteriaceae bacterium]|jgi:cold shock CspA family protein|nr:cold shock domain-containing protein [Cyclobacteriaceae bacterium]